MPGELFYWREGNREVDFVYRFGKKIVAIEVKSSPRVRGDLGSPGLAAFQRKVPSVELRIATPENWQELIQELQDF